MPTMTISHRRTGKDSVSGKSRGTFTGDVYLDPVLNADKIMVVNVNFMPCARTYWHRHEGGQLLRVLAGSGWVCDKEHEPQRIEVGDVIWCPPGTVHWHGAAAGSYMVHQAVSHGTTEWFDEVKDEELGVAKGGASSELYRISRHHAATMSL